MVDSNIDVTLLATGEGALEALKSNMPDILILDILLPGINGIDLLGTIRRDPVTKNLPVLVVSNTDQAESRAKVAALGGHFLIKAMVTPSSIVKHAQDILAGTV